MILEYKFEYLSNNNTLVNFLTNIADASDMKFEITKEKNEINFYVDADEEAMSSFASTIASDLPMSVFLQNTAVSLVQEMPPSNIQADKTKQFNLPFCPKCLQKAESAESSDYYNPFTTCPMCCDTKDIKEFIVSFGDEIKRTDAYKEVFEDLASRIHQGLGVRFKTLSGTFIFEKLENLQEDKNQKDIKLLCTNLANISNVVVAKKAEIVALACIEKPQMDFRINELYKSKNIIQAKRLSVRYPNDLILYLLSKELRALGIDFLSYKNEGSYDINVDFENFDAKESLKIPKLKILEQNRALVLESENYDKKFMQVFESLKEKNKAHFMVLLYENSLLQKRILNFYTSSRDDDNVSYYAKDLEGFLDVLNYRLPKSIQEVFEDIQKEESGERLLKNYKNKYPDSIKTALEFDLSVLKNASIVSFWKIAESILGFKNSILDNASLSLLEKGPRIDYKLFESARIYNKEFNYIKLIQSGMSFRLAGVDERTISLGYIESYAHFISNIADEVNKEMELEGISLSGDIFADERISHYVHKSIGKNFKIFYNKDFVIQTRF
ncbi:hypothetical protein KJ877_02910 [bacterium]|nr:hypothetical protein [bacterium]MBU1989428.1 hypothetical protein [bacterium]